MAFWRKTAKTMGHVDTSFKGYQPYEFTYIRDLAEPSRKLTGGPSSDGTKSKKKDVSQQEDEDAQKDSGKPSEDKDE